MYLEGLFICLLYDKIWESALLVNQIISLGGVSMYYGFIEYFKHMSLWQVLQRGRVATHA